jgi:hypothetical protein
MRHRAFGPSWPNEFIIGSRDALRRGPATCVARSAPPVNKKSADLGGQASRQPPTGQTADATPPLRTPPAHLSWAPEPDRPHLGVKGSQVQILSARLIDTPSSGLVTARFLRLQRRRSRDPPSGFGPIQPPPGRNRTAGLRQGGRIRCRVAAVTAGSWCPATRCSTYSGDPTVSHPGQGGVPQTMAHQPVQAEVDHQSVLLRRIPQRCRRDHATLRATMSRSLSPLGGVSRSRVGRSGSMIGTTRRRRPLVDLVIRPPRPG